MKRYILIWLSCFAFSCSKDAGSTGIDCSSLQQGLTNDDVAVVSASLGDLPNETYSEENINQIAKDMNDGCDMTVGSICFDCIKTLPPQTEMSIMFLDSHGTSTTKVLDLTIADNNTIKIVAIH